VSKVIWQEAASWANQERSYVPHTEIQLDPFSCFGLSITYQRYRHTDTQPVDKTNRLRCRLKIERGAHLYTVGVQNRLTTDLADLQVHASLITEVFATAGIIR